MDNVVFDTPSGHTVTLKPYLTFGDKRQLERVFAEASTLDAAGNAQASGKAVYDAQDKAVSLMVLRIQTAEGLSFDNDDPRRLLEVIYSMKEEDGRAIYDKVNELTAPKLPAPQGEKRGS